MQAKYLKRYFTHTFVVNVSGLTEISRIMRIISQIVEILALGLVLGAVPGPMLTAVFTVVANRGFWEGFKVILRAFMSEIIVAGLILLTLFSIDIPRCYFCVISLAGTLFLVYLSHTIWKIDTIIDEQKEMFGFSKIFLLTALNGAFWTLWITVCVPRAFALNEMILGGRFIFLATVESGWLIMTSTLAFIFSRFRPLLLQKNLISPVFKFLALVLVYFAMRSLSEIIDYLLRSLSFS